MFFYKLDNKLLFSKAEYTGLKRISEAELINYDGVIHYLLESNPQVTRRSYSLSDASLFLNKKEDYHLLLKEASEELEVPNWLNKKIDAKLVKAINTSYPKWEDALLSLPKARWRVNIVGLGDVGGTLVTGLRLLGCDCISNIGLYDLDSNKTKRWELESSQILDVTKMKDYPTIKTLKEEELFDCDMFVFCVSLGVPPIGAESTDVRMAQLAGNSRIINMYAKKARELNYKGIFAVVSDPVDQLCKTAFTSSNTNSEGDLDYRGLAPEQIRGYGLGVMNARAVYYANVLEIPQYIDEGRVFGPHGEGLIVANSIKNYNHELSLELTNKVINANIEVRKTGYKPYIAPAFSSGSLSIINTIKGDWHYSSNYLGGVYMGARNRLHASGIELERNDLDIKLIDRIKDTYERLAK